MRKRWTTVVNLAHRLPLFAPEFSRISGRNSCRFVLVFPFQMSSSVHTSLPNNFPHHTPIGIRSYSPSPLCPRASVLSCRFFPHVSVVHFVILRSSPFISTILHMPARRDVSLSSSIFFASSSRERFAVIINPFDSANHLESTIS